MSLDILLPAQFKRKPPVISKKYKRNNRL